jgi:hypothetical protein
VPIKRARSIDDIFDRASNADLVLSTEGPLTLALDRRISQPRLGRLSATPRSYAANDMVPQDQRPLFLALIQQTPLSWKEAAFATQHILDCWDRTGDLTRVLQAQYDTDPIQTALEVLQTEPSSYRALQDATPPEGDVVVAGERFFTELDKNILPADYDSISLFEEGEFELPEFRIFDSPTDIVDTLLSHISSHNADDVAIVVDKNSSYSTLIESAFAANDIPHRGGPGFEDNPLLRAFIRLLRAGFDSQDLSLRDLRPVLVQLGIYPPIADENRRLRAVNHPDVEAIVDFIDRIPTSTFGEALEQYRSHCDAGLWELKDELEHLGLLSSDITPAGIDDLEFYLDSFDVPTETPSEGVLLTSATSSVYVDRPTVFYIGLGRGWERAVPDRPWINEATVDQRNLERFQLLLQNGQQRHYFVVNSVGGEPVSPCLYFEDLLETEYDTFDDLNATQHGVQRQHGGDSFPHKPPEVNLNPEPVTSLSQGSLSTLVNCPRDYYMSQLVEDATNQYLARGTSFHEAAELHAIDSSVIHENRDQVIDWIVSNQRPFLGEHDVETWRTTAAVGLDLLTSYLDEIPIERRAYSGYEPFGEPNELAVELDSKDESTFTEQWFANDQFNGHGVVDLIADPQTVIDYKTGSKSTATSVLRDGDPDEPSDTPNFQPYHYLAHHRSVVPDEPLSFKLVHFLEYIDEAIVDRESVAIEDSVTEIEYRPESFSGYISSKEVYEWLWEDISESNNRRKTLTRMGYEPYASFFESREFPTTDSKDALLETEFADEFEQYCVTQLSDKKLVRRGARSTLKKLFSLREGVLFEDDLDAYEAYLEGWIDQLNTFRATQFPVGDPNDDRLSHPLLIVGGDSR